MRRAVCGCGRTGGALRTCRSVSRRAEKVAGLAAIHGELTSEDDVLEVSAPTKVRWWLAGQNGSRVSIAIILTPQLPPKVQ
eukprot:COSAG06_NODE_66069_length_255_cov_0.685897_1_plen_80_part_10